MSLVVPPYPPPRYTKDAPEVSAWLKRSDEPPDYQTYGVKYHYLANQQATGGDYGLYRVDIDPAGGGPPEHFHRAMSEAFFVLSGTMKLYDGSKNGDWLDSAGRHDRRRTPGVVHPPRQLLRVDVLPPGSAELREVGTLRLALLDEDEHHAPRVDEPCCANSRHVGECRRQESARRWPRVGPGWHRGSRRSAPHATTRGRKWPRRCADRRPRRRDTRSPRAHDLRRRRSRRWPLSWWDRTPTGPCRRESRHRPSRKAATAHVGPTRRDKTPPPLRSRAHTPRYGPIR